MLLLLSLLLLPTLTSSLPTRHITAASVDHFIDGETIQAGRWVAHDAAAPSSSKHPAYGVGIEFEREKIAALSEGERGAGAGWGHSSSAPASAANHLEVCPLGSQRCKVWEPEVMTDGGGRGPLVERFEVSRHVSLGRRPFLGCLSRSVFGSDVEGESVSEMKVDPRKGKSEMGSASSSRYIVRCCLGCCGPFAAVLGVRCRRASRAWLAVNREAKQRIPFCWGSTRRTGTDLCCPLLSRCTGVRSASCRRTGGSRR